MLNLFNQSIPAPWSIIHQGITIYRANFPIFFKMSLYCNAWFLAANLPWLFLVGMLFVLYIFLTSPAVFTALFSYLPSGMLGHVLIATLVILIISLCLSPFTSAKGLLRQALIGQVAYQILVEQSETLQVNLHRLRPRLWQFWLAEVYINGVISAVEPMASRLGEWVVFALNIWLMAQWFLANFVIAVEDCNVTKSLRISRDLSKPHMLNICCILIGTWVLTLPLYLLAFSPAIAVWLVEKQNLAPAQLNTESLFHLMLALGLSIILATLFHTLTIPLWQSIKAVLYYNLRPSNLTSA